MAKDGNLPKIYERNVWHSSEGLIISAIFIALMILFFKLSQIATIGSIYILFIHVFVHIGHLFKIKVTEANRVIIIFSILSLMTTIVLALIYTAKHVENIG